MILETPADGDKHAIDLIAKAAEAVANGRKLRDVLEQDFEEWNEACSEERTRFYLLLALISNGGVILAQYAQAAGVPVEQMAQEWRDQGYLTRVEFEMRDDSHDE